MSRKIIFLAYRRCRPHRPAPFPARARGLTVLAPMWGDSTHDLLLLSVIKFLGKLDLKTRDGPGLLRVSPWPALFYFTYKFNLSDSKLFYAKLDILPFEIYQNSEPPAGRTSGMSGPVQKEPYPGRGRGRPAEGSLAMSIFPSKEVQEMDQLQSQFCAVWWR